MRVKYAKFYPQKWDKHAKFHEKNPKTSATSWRSLFIMITPEETSTEEKAKKGSPAKDGSAKKSSPAKEGSAKKSTPEKGDSEKKATPSKEDSKKRKASSEQAKSAEKKSKNWSDLSIFELLKWLFICQ